MGRFEVTPDELVGAAGTLRSIRADLSTACGGRGTGGDLGSPELEGALDSLLRAVDRVTDALDGAVVAAALNTNAAADAYTTVDATSMGGGG